VFTEEEDESVVEEDESIAESESVEESESIVIKSKAKRGKTTQKPTRGVPNKQVKKGKRVQASENSDES
jgi:hypothetical protein